MFGRAALFAISLLVLSCGEVRLTRATARVEVTPSALDLGSVLVGRSGEGAIEVRNGGRSPTTVYFRAEAPFHSFAEVSLAPGERRTVVVTFEPTSEVESEGALTAVSEDGVSIEVRVRGRGIMPQACTPAECQVATVHAVTGVCELTRAPEGTVCASACLVSATCVSGECVGQARSCDDGNACTRDACDPVSGCVHTQVECASDDPCMAAACDPLRGCVTVAVDDGTSCGRRGCDVQDVCISGVCSERPAADGMECGDWSPCQSPGVCREGACERPSPTELALAWERPGYVHFDGLLDGDGNLYLNELRLDGGYALLSLTPAGAERYRVPYPEDAPETPEAVFGSLLISRVPVGLNRFEYRARRTADAAVVWTSTLTDVLGEHVDQPPASMRPKVLSVSSVHEAKGGHLGVMVVGWLQHPDGHLESADLLRAEIDAFTGALRKVVRVGDNYGTAIARLGGDFVVSDGNEVRAFTSEGATAWTTSPSAEQHVLASSGSALIVGKDGPDCMGSGGNFQWSLEVRDSSTGTVRGSPPLTGKWETHRAPPLVANEGQSWVIGQPAFPAGTSCDQLGEHGLYKLDLQSGTILGQYPLDWPLGATRGTCSWLSTPQLGLTNRNSLLAFSFVQSCSNEPRWFVREFSRAGVQSWTCRVGTPQDPYQTQFTFTHGHLVPHSTYGSVEGLRAYVLPGYGPATRGWSGDRGNPQQTSVERP